MGTRARNLVAVMLSGLALTGCTHLGPKTITLDRVDYGTAVSESWKQQMVLNIVKLRYSDLPVFIDVPSIVSGYSMETSVDLGGEASSNHTGSLSLGAGRVFTDRPTITYAPMTGDKFLHGMLTPIDPKNIFFLMQAGYPADFVLGLTVDALNGVRNRSATANGVREADPDFSRVLGLLRELQAAGAIGMRVEQDKAKGEAAVVFFRGDDPPPEIVTKLAEVRRLLKLPADQQRYALVYSPMRGSDKELAVNSRSLLQILTTFASYVDVPDADLKNHSAVDLAPPPDGAQDEVRIHSGKERPSLSYAAVRYRDYWFWIDDGDLRTKRALTALMFFFTLSETSGNEKLPLITIPAQ